MKRFDTTKLIGFAGIFLGMLATAVSSHAQSKQMERTIEEKVNEALANREENIEES